MSEQLDINVHPPFGYTAINRSLFAETVGAMALKRVLRELPDSAVVEESVALIHDPVEAERIVGAIPFLGVLRDQLADTVDDSELSEETACLLGGCAAAIALEYAADRDPPVCEFEDQLLKQAQELGKGGVDRYRAEDQEAVLLLAMDMLDGDNRARAAADLAEELEEKVKNTGLPQVAEWAEWHVRTLSKVEGVDAGAENNPLEDILRDADNAFEALQGLLAGSSFARAISAGVIGDTIMSNPGTSLSAQFVAGINRVLAFVMVGTERLAAPRLSHSAYLRRLQAYQSIRPSKKDSPCH